MKSYYYPWFANKKQIFVIWTPEQRKTRLLAEIWTRVPSSVLDCKPKSKVVITIWHCDNSVDLKSKQIWVLPNIVASCIKLRHACHAEGPPLGISSSLPEHDSKDHFGLHDPPLAVPLELAMFFWWICLSLHLLRSSINFHFHVAKRRISLSLYVTIFLL